MSEHTPDTEQVRDAFAMRRWDTFQLNYPNSRDEAEREQEGEAFDRWLAGVVRDAKAEALRDAAEDINGESHLLQCPRPETRAQSWLLDRADQIERTDDA